MNVSACVYGSQRLTSGVSLDLTLPYIFNQGFLLEAELAYSASLAIQLALRIQSLPSEAGGKPGPPCPLGSYVDSPELNSGFHIWAVSTFATGPSP